MTPDPLYGIWFLSLKSEPMAPPLPPHFGGPFSTLDLENESTNTGYSVLDAQRTNVLSISQSEFIGNENHGVMLYVLNGTITNIHHSKFINNTGYWFLYASDADIIIISVTHNEFVDNIIDDVLLYLEQVVTTLNLNEFINNIADRAVVYIPYYTTAENLTGNVFTDNSAAYELFIGSGCSSGLGLSLGSSRCIQCSENWRQDMVGIVIAAFIAGIALVIFKLALNMTVAIGTLNGILFYANVIAANVDTYFLPFSTNDFITVFISWLNLDIGFDVCFAKTESLYDVSL